METTYEDQINLPSILFILINKFNMAVIDKKEVGTMELTVLLKNIPTELKKECEDEIKQINLKCEEMQNKLKNEWVEVVGNPSNTPKLVLTPKRIKTYDELRTLANLDIIEVIQNMLMRHGLSLTTKTNMPSSLVS